MVTDLFSKMTRAEIRALGTHQSKQGTLRSIEYNVYVHLFRRLFREISALQNVRVGIEPGDEGGQAELTSLGMALEEIERKSNANQKDYASARNKLVGASGDPANDAARFALGVFETPESIWNSPEVRQWWKHGQDLKHLLDYVKALRAVLLMPTDADFGEDAEEKKARVQALRDRGLNALQALRKAFGIEIPGLPRTARDSFVWDDLRRAVVRIFAGLPGATDYRRRFEQSSNRYTVT